MVPDYKPLKLVKRLIYLFDTAQSSQIDFNVSPTRNVRQSEQNKTSVARMFCSILMCSLLSYKIGLVTQTKSV